MYFFYFNKMQINTGKRKFILNLMKYENIIKIFCKIDMW